MLVGKSSDDGLRARGSVYEHLPVGEELTRVLLLQTSISDATPVACSLEVMTLKPKPSRTYLALSYPWGDPSITEDIWVNGVCFPVTTNLASALRQLRKMYKEVYVWADAVAINQRDIPERNQQVLLMRTIYSGANHVVGWLGADTDGGSQALGDLDRLLDAVAESSAGFEWTKRVPELLVENERLPIAGGGSVLTNARVEKIALLLARPFWRRIWIVQELILPDVIRLCCGDKLVELPATAFFRKAVILLSTQSSNGRPRSMSVFIQRRIVECASLLTVIVSLRQHGRRPEHMIDQAWHGITGFFSARPRLVHHETSDPRDHVYGLLGVLDLDIKPDYSENETVARVFTEVARHGLNTRYPDTLSLAGISNDTKDSSTSTPTDLPSWVPDWRVPPPETIRVRRYPQSHAFPAREGSGLQVVDGKWLRGSSVVWDKVSRTEEKTGWDLTEWDIFKTVDMAKPEDQEYPSGISRFQAFPLLWVGGYDNASGHPSDLQLDSELFKSYERIFWAAVIQSLRARDHELLAWKVLQPMLQIYLNKPTPLEHRESYTIRSRQLRFGLRYFQTEKGYIGFGPLATKPGDHVCVLEGHKSPVLLREQDVAFRFVGDCDVVGIMNGELLEKASCGEAEIIEIEIR